MKLISILGEFDSSILPIFFQYKRKLTKHTLIYTISSYSDQKHKDRITRGLEALVEKYSLNCELEFLEVDAQNLEEIKIVASKLTADQDKENLLLNITDGRSTISFLLARYILSFGAKILLYDRYKNSYFIADQSEIKQYQITKNMKIDDHLVSKGYKIISRKNPADLKRRKPFIMTIAENFDLFQKFRKLSMSEKRIQSPEFEPIKRALKLLGVTTNKGHILKDHYILGGLFEELIYHIVNDLGFDDVVCGAVVLFGTPDQPVKNEFDLLLIKNNHLSVIECKFRDKVDGEFLIYKYDALLHYLDRDGKAMIISVASTKTKELISRKKRMRESFEKGTKNRAEHTNIMIYHEPTLEIEKLQLMIKSFFEI